MKPFFSILIPTRNRCDLLIEGALKSVLNQTFSDFEVVVCDNASTDNTGECIKKIRDARIRYVYSPEWIPKEHFFEFAYRQARGEFSLLFCDDDYLPTTTLEKAFSILSSYNTHILSFSRDCIYHYPDWHESSKRNVLVIPPFTGKLFRIESLTHLQMIFERIEILTETPMVVNAFYRTSFIRSLLDKFEHLFPHGHMGDYNLTCHVLSQTASYLYLDEPLAILAHWKENTPAQLHRFKTTMPEYQEWIKWFTDTYLSNMPVKTYQWKNCVAATLLDMKKILNLPWTINIVNYFYALIQELLCLEIRGIDISIQKKECFKAFSSLPPELQRNILKAIEKGPEYHITNVLQVLNCNIPNPVQSHSNPRLGNEEIKIKGALYGFNSIYSAGEFYERFLADKVKLSDDALLSDESPETEATEDYLKGISAIAKQFSRIFIVGTNAIARTTAKILGPKIAYVGDINFLLEGKKLIDGLRIEGLNVLSEGDFDCVIMTIPDSKPLIEYIKKTLRIGRSNYAKIYRLKDIIHYGALIRQIEDGNIEEVLQLMDKIIQYGETLVKRNRLHEALVTFLRLLERIQEVKGTLINNLAVIHTYNGNLDVAEELLSYLIREGYQGEEAKKNLGVVRRMLSQKSLNGEEERANLS